MRIGCHPPNRAASAILASRVWGLSETNRTHRSTWSAGTASSAASASRNRKLRARARPCLMDGGRFRTRPALRSDKPARALIGFRSPLGNAQTSLSYISAAGLPRENHVGCGHKVFPRAILARQPVGSVRGETETLSGEDIGNGHVARRFFVDL